ncbi:MAG TPA: S8 family serine peptidase [Verrucomicrobiae bacterium]|nr:S8 family serine peptidase [Verrucomicrobiae bacterium]
MTKEFQMTNDEWRFDARFVIRHSSFVILFSLLLACGSGARAAETNSNLLVWHKAADRVDANIRGEPLWPLLEDVARQTGWHIFVETGATRNASVKFKELPSNDALRMLLGKLNFALVPGTNGPARLYVFTTRMENATQPVRAPRGPPKHVPNELLVKVKPGTDMDALAKAIGAKIIGRDDKLGIYRLQFGDAAATDAALAQLKNNSDVVAVDYNYYFDPPPSPQLMANSSVAPLSLKLDPTSDSSDPCHVTVGLIDTPLQSLGSQLDQFVVKSIPVAGDAKPDPANPTHATGMLYNLLYSASQAGHGSSSLRVVAVDVYGQNPMTTSWDVALGVQAAVNNGANVLNMSLGSGGDSSVLDSVIKQAIADGIMVFAAAGNEPVASATYPAAIPGVNAVTATQNGQIAPYADYGNFVSMALPGANVVYYNNQPYVYQGTSVSTALATGVAAGTKGADCWSWPQIQTAMQQKFAVPAK